MKISPEQQSHANVCEECFLNHLSLNICLQHQLLFSTIELPSIILQNQVPKGMKRSETLMQMEAAIKKYTSEVFLTEDDLYDADKKQPPRFVTQIKDQTDLVEMQSTKFECQLAPVGDPNMKVYFSYFLLLLLRN